MRLVTRSDFDGLACAVLLVEVGLVDKYKFVHPKDMQDGSVEITSNDILANVPYVEGCALWFDHHSSEEERLQIAEDFDFHGCSRREPSCARVIYNYFGGAGRFAKFDHTGLMAAVDKSDSGQFSVMEISNPTGWALLSFMMDARTGLGRFRDYRISNLQLMTDMIEYCRYMNAEQILAVPDVDERVQRYWEQELEFEDMIRRCARTDGNVLIIDLHEEESILSGNRFKEYVLYPDQNISVRLMWGRQQQNMVITVGHSIVNKTARANVGSLMLKYGGGGHRAVGTCQVPVDRWEQALAQIIEAVKEPVAEKV